MFDVVSRVAPDDRVRCVRLGQGIGSSRDLKAGGKQLVADAGEAEVGDLEGAVLGDQEVAGLDVAMAAQALADRVLHAQAELDAEPEAWGSSNRGEPIRRRSSPPVTSSSTMCGLPSISSTA